MGLYLSAVAASSEPIALVAKARSYTLYQREGGTWYVNFRVDSRQCRLSTGTTDYTRAKGLVESFRGAKPAEERAVNGFHIERMIERARLRARKKGLEFRLNTKIVREAVDRAGGCCEVSGHPLEDEGPFRPSLDRIDCTKGYTPENVRVVCLITNTAMLHYGEAAFFELAIATCRNRGLLTEQV